MNKIRMPWKDLIPAWYEIGIYEKTTLVINIHAKVLSLFDMLKSDSPIVKHYEKEFDLPSFIMPTAERWGFGEVIQRVPNESGWVSYHCPLPIYKKHGERNRSDKGTAATVRTTLSILFGLLDFCPEEDTEYRVSQLVIIDGFLVQNDLHGGSLSATITPAMTPFLSSPSVESLRSIQDSMRTAYEHMWQERKHSKLFTNDFRVHYQEPTKIHLTVPGDACGLDPAFGDYDGASYGYRLVPHNVDSGMQQLSLLMGLARLHELGRAMYI